MKNTEINQRIGMLFLGLQDLSTALIGEKRGDDARAVDGMALRLRQMAHADAPAPKKTQRRVVWMAGRTIPLNERPTRVWAFEDAYDCASPPVVPTKLIDGHNAFEREPEDWNCTNALFTYTPLGEFRPCWLLLEYEG